MPAALSPRRLVTLGACALALAACAGNPGPPPALVQARAAIGTADNPNTEHYAPLDLEVARDKLAAAETLAAQGDQEQSARLAEEAQVNAQLALARADAEQAKEATRQLQATLGTAPAGPQSAAVPPARPEATMPPPALTAPMPLR